MSRRRRSACRAAASTSAFEDLILRCWLKVQTIDPPARKKRWTNWILDAGGRPDVMMFEEPASHPAQCGQAVGSSAGCAIEATPQQGSLTGGVARRFSASLCLRVLAASTPTLLAVASAFEALAARSAGQRSPRSRARWDRRHQADPLRKRSLRARLDRRGQSLRCGELES